MIYDASLDELLQKVWDGQRINPAEALRLYPLPLEELGALADRRRQLAKAKDFNGRGNDIVTYQVDRNVNYTNVCNVYCKFCAFYRTEKDADAYVITLAEMDEKIAETVALGGTQILMQGGHHPKLTKQWYLDLLSHVKTKWPQVNIHGFSPSEFIHFREVFNEPLDKIIGDFVKAGLGSIPGGGGEILVDRVRQRISPLKAMSDDWLEVMDVAHRLGLSSSATMMFGHVETIEDRIEHLDRLRVQQDKSKRKAESGNGEARFPISAFPLSLLPAFHRVHLLDVPGRAHKAQGADRRRARIFADAGVGPDLPRQFHQRPEFVGHARPGNRPDRPQIRRERPRPRSCEMSCRPG